jgi:hypothetical protein
MKEVVWLSWNVGDNLSGTLAAANEEEDEDFKRDDDGIAEGGR